MAGPATQQIDLLGGFRVADGTPVRQPGARQQQLICFLVLHARDAAVTRQRVAASLWPDSTDEQALTNLRRELHHLRENWPKLDALIDAGSRTLAWQSKAAVVDLVAFDDAATRGLAGDRRALGEAATLYKGDLLPDCTGEWIDGDRERLRRRATEVLRQLVARLEQERAFGDAIEHAQHLLRLDPVDEQAWCVLMRCHARRGDRATALHLYQQCAALLKKELGVSPSAATRLTYREILNVDETAMNVEAAPRATVYPLVGRQSEWRAVLGAWQTAAAGQTRLLVIRGEAGIGKTRLAEELLAWSSANGIKSASARCFSGEGRLAYAPLAAWLKGDALRAPLMALETAQAADVARLRPDLLVDRPDVAAPNPQLESWQRLPFFDALAQAFRSAAPLILVLDDVQWADGDTIDWLHYFVRTAAETRCLVAATLRAEEEQDNPALRRMLTQLERDRLVSTISLGPLDRTATAQLAGEVAEHPLDETAIARAFRETEGHPLFIVERGRMDPERRTDTSSPSEVQSVVSARLALLSDDARVVAELASAVGRDFRFDILAQASDLEEATLVRALDELWQRQIVRVQADERWDFSHDRIREVAYGGIGPARRRLIHRRIAQGMELLFANRLDEASASIAAHLDRGGQPARAVLFLERAAAVATRVSATEEAIRCLTHALTLLDKLPPGRDRNEQELTLRSTLSGALNTGRGYAAPEVEENLDRVFALTLADGGAVPVRWLWVAFTLRFMLGDLRATREVAEQALAASIADPSCRCEAHHAMGGMLQSLGELEESRRQFEAALAVYDETHPQSTALGSDLGVFAHAWSSHTLWLLGDDEGAVTRVNDGIELARRLDHKYSQTLALAYAALLHQMRGDVDRLMACAEEAAALCARYGFAYYGDWVQALMGWARGLENPAEGIVMIESAIERLDRHRARARRPYYLSLLAETYGRLGDTHRAASIVDAAIAMAVDRGDVWWLPALYLQKSGTEPPAAAEATRQRALAMAQSQANRALERRILSSTAGTLSRTL